MPISAYQLFEQKINQYKIFCDLDGVLTDFETSAKQVEPNFKKNPIKMWKKIDKVGVTFWSDLNWTKDGKELWNYIKSYNPIILSGPPSTGKISAIRGKKQWIRKELGHIFEKTAIITFKKNKIKYTGKNHILIDDSASTIELWRKAGGIGILHRTTQNTIKQLKKLDL